MANNVYVIRGQEDNVKAQMRDKEVEIAKAVYDSKVIDNKKISNNRLKKAKDNKAEYYVELLSENDSLEGEYVFARNGINFVEEGSERNLDIVGFYKEGQIVDVYEEYTEGRVGVYGGMKSYDMIVHLKDGHQEFYYRNDFIRKI